MSEHAQRIERSVDLPAEAPEVWEAVTDPDLLGEWFDGDVRIEPIAGGEVVTENAPEPRRGRVEVAEPEHELAFRWWRWDGVSPPRDGRRVRIVLTPTDDGTRVTVTEEVLGSSARVLARSA